MYTLNIYQFIIYWLYVKRQTKNKMQMIFLFVKYLLQESGTNWLLKIHLEFARKFEKKTPLDFLPQTQEYERIIKKLKDK